MAQRLLQLSDVRETQNPDKVVGLFNKLGYKTFGNAQSLGIKDLELSPNSEKAIEESYLIADHNKDSESLQVLLFQLSQEEWKTPGIAGNRMKSIAQGLSRRPSNFLLLGTRNFKQIMLVNPRKSLDAQMNLRVGIRKLLIDRQKPTPYDRDRLEAIAARDFEPNALYQAQCTAFDVEKLTKQFYQGYQEIFQKVQRTIYEQNPHPYFDDPTRLYQFSQRLLGRVMFLYFLQKKEFLAGRQDFLSYEFSRYTNLEDTDFYHQVLEPLFFEILNCDRPNAESPWGKIPYLNGGLFERDYGGFVDASGWETPKEILLPNSLFTTQEGGVLKFFNSYNFTVSENIEGDEDIAVDPEMLGKVFENMLAADERGQSGTFYTPRGVVQFMCVESLSRYLADETGMELDIVRQLTEFDPALHEEGINALLTKEQAKKIKKALASVKICDPSVGSGAYPIGMMQVILAVKQAIACREEGRSVKRGSLRISEWKREIIANNLYGVDIKPEAIEIAKLRMWLSMVVDIPTIEDVEPLPNLDYKLMTGNSLISTICGERVIPDARQDTQLALAVNPVMGEIQTLARLQKAYFDSSSDDRKALSAEILEAEKQVFRLAIEERRSFWQSEQQRLAKNGLRMKGKLSRSDLKLSQEVEAKLKELDRMENEVVRGLKSLDFFQWQLHFHDVFQEKGGFDIVIGNPPYVRQEKLGEEFKNGLKIEFPELYKGTADLYTYFYGRGIELLHPKGYLAFITSNKWFRANYGANLRNYLYESCTIHSITDFGELPVFDAATFPMIFVAQRGKDSDVSTLFTQVKSLESPYPNVGAVVSANGTYLPKDALQGENWRLSSSNSVALLQKMEVASVSLDEYVHGKIYRGVLTGFNAAFKITDEKRRELIAQDPRSAEIIKPLAVGDDIRKWHIREKNNWLIFTRRGIDIDKYPAIKAHLSQWKEELTPKILGSEEKGRKPGRYKWYEIQDDVAYYESFEKPKIIYPVISKESRFVVDFQGYFTNDKAFIIPVNDLYLIGVLNSSSVWCFLRSICSVLGDPDKGGRLELRSIYINKIPIPKASTKEQSAISALVQKCLDDKGQGVEHWEAEINDRVARLYGLTDAEIAAIEGDR